MKQEIKNWLSLFTANFLSVFNDNFIKHSIVFIGVTWNLPAWFSQSQVIAAVSAALVLPYLFFSPLAGKWAVRYRRQKIFLYLKIVEIPIVIVACVAFYFQWIVLAIIAVLLMGIASCLYSPAKYSLIRDIGGEKKVSFGSGMIEAMAFAGVLIGTVAASVFSDHYAVIPLITLFLLVSVCSLLFVLTIRVPEQTTANDDTTGSSSNPFLFLKHNYRFAKQIPFLLTAVLGYSIFWLVAGMVQMNMVIHCTQTLSLSNSSTGIMMAMAAMGVIFGCFLVGKLSKDKVNLKFSFIGIVGMILLLLFIILLKPNTISFAVLIFLFAFLSGFFQVPCLAFIQQSNIGRKLGDMMAFLNLITFLFVLFGTVLFSVISLAFNNNSTAIWTTMLIIMIATFVSFRIKWNNYKKLLQKNKDILLQ